MRTAVCRLLLDQYFVKKFVGIAAAAVSLRRVEAEDEVTSAFRIPGRFLKNNGKLGDRVQPGKCSRGWNRRMS
jgi:hypothetical protein